MRIGTVLDFGRPMSVVGDEIAAWEQAGLSSVTLGEAYSFDAATQLAYLAARTTSIELATGVIALGHPAPRRSLRRPQPGSTTVSAGRARLGLGPSGPQVVEGFHGIPFADIVGKTRETVEICRSVWRRETLKHDGEHYQIPLDPSRGTGLGKPLKLINRPVRDRIPVSSASLGPRMVELTAEVADGWEPIFFYPEKLHEVWGRRWRKVTPSGRPTSSRWRSSCALPWRSPTTIQPLDQRRQASTGPVHQGNGLARA